MKFRTGIGLAFLSVLSAAATAQFYVDSAAGGVGFVPGDRFSSASISLVSGDSLRFSGSTSEPDWLGSPYGSRGVVRFQATGSLQMSSDNLGNLSLASDGEVRRFTTWNSVFSVEFGGPSYQFGVEYDAGQTDPASVDIAYYDMSYENLTGETGPVRIGLDNSEYDLNPALGKIKIDRRENPLIEGTFASITGGRARRELYFNGDEYVAAPFFDSFFSTAQLEISKDGSFITNFGWTPSESLGVWAPGEDDSVWREFESHDLAMSFDFSQIENGIYQGRAYAALWQSMGSETTASLTGLSWYPGSTSSEFDGSVTEYEIEVVPEPGTLAALGLGAAALLRRHKK